jgi:hypothetical protein
LIAGAWVFSGSGKIIAGVGRVYYYGRAIAEDFLICATRQSASFDNKRAGIHRGSAGNTNSLPKSSPSRSGEIRADNAVVQLILQQ